MIRVEHVIQIPSGLSNMPAVDQEVTDFREEVMEWSIANGLVDHGTQEVSPIERVQFYVWANPEALEAFNAHFGQRYQTYFEDWHAAIEAVGGSIIRTIR